MLNLDEIKKEIQDFKNETSEIKSKLEAQQVHLAKTTTLGSINSNFYTSIMKCF